MTGKRWHRVSTQKRAGTLPTDSAPDRSARTSNSSSPGPDPVICRGTCVDRWQARWPAMTGLASCQKVKGSDGWNEMPERRKAGLSDRSRGYGVNLGDVDRNAGRVQLNGTNVD